MLYISKANSGNEIYVIDTNNGVEEFQGDCQDFIMSSEVSINMKSGIFKDKKY